MIGDSTSESSVDKLRSMIGDSTSGDRMVWRNPSDSTRRIDSLHTRLLSTYSLPAGADTPVSRSRSYSENRNDLSENRKRFKRRDSDSGIQDSFQIRRSSSLRDSIDLLYKKQRDARVDKVLAMERVSTLARTWRQKVRASRRRKEKKRVLPEKIEEGEESGEAE